MVLSMWTNRLSSNSLRHPSVPQDPVTYARKRSAYFCKEDSGSIIIFWLFLLIIRLFTIVLQNNAQNSGVTSISIIAHNATIVVGNPILLLVNANGTRFDILSPLTIAGALTSHLSEDDESTCMGFRDDDFTARAPSSTDIMC